MHRRKLLTTLFAIFLLPTAATPAVSGVVHGILTTYKGRTAAGVQIHFENSISGDIYLIHTNSDGSFSADLPPGSYSLREKRGAVITRLSVGETSVDLGRVSVPAPLHPMRLFQWEEMGDAIVKTPAPSTARVPATTFPDETQGIAQRPAPVRRGPLTQSTARQAH